MTRTAEAFYSSWPTTMQEMKAATPSVARGFGSMYATLMKSERLDVIQKELIAIGIAVAIRCDRCILAHVQKALELGADREQILESAGVAVMMGGGPAYTSVPTVVQAIEACEASAG